MTAHASEGIPAVAAFLVMANPGTGSDMAAHGTGRDMSHGTGSEIAGRVDVSRGKPQ